MHLRAVYFYKGIKRLPDRSTNLYAPLEWNKIPVVVIELTFHNGEFVAWGYAINDIEIRLSIYRDVILIFHSHQKEENFVGGEGEGVKTRREK